MELDKVYDTEDHDCTKDGSGHGTDTLGNLSEQFVRWINVLDSVKESGMEKDFTERG